MGTTCKPLVSVYTCVYNGERTIHRVFKSIKSLNYENIEHVIVNDGSTDNTDALVKEYIKEVSYPVKYVVKENGGKHSALNIAWDTAEGFFMIQLDADDEIYPDSVSKLVEQYYNIPSDIRDEYWCVHGRLTTQHGDFVGDKYPDGLNEKGWKVAGEIARKCRGDKIGLQRRDYLKPYRYPEIKGVPYVLDAIIWDQVNKKYGTWYTNEIVGTYYVGEGGNLTARKTKRRQFGTTAHFYKYKITHEEQYGKSLKNIFLYSFCYFLTGKEYKTYNPYFKDIKEHKFLLTLLAPTTFPLALLYRIVKGIKN